MLQFIPPPINEQGVSFYAGVIQIQLKIMVRPVFEIITSQHDSHKTSFQWPLFITAVTDLSFTIISAVVYKGNILMRVRNLHRSKIQKRQLPLFYPL